jgi:hypothetical protein
MHFPDYIEAGITQREECNYATMGHRRIGYPETVFNSIKTNNLARRSGAQV